MITRHGRPIVIASALALASCAPVESEQPPTLFPVDLACKDGTCTFDAAAVSAALDDRNLRVRLVPVSNGAGGYKLFGVTESSFYWAAGLASGDTLVEIDRSSASAALAGDDPAAVLQARMRQLFARGGRVELRIQTRDGVEKHVTLIANGRAEDAVAP